MSKSLNAGPGLSPSGCAMLGTQTSCFKASSDVSWGAIAALLDCSVDVWYERWP